MVLGLALSLIQIKKQNPGGGFAGQMDGG